YTLSLNGVNRAGIITVGIKHFGNYNIVGNPMRTVHVYKAGETQPEEVVVSFDYNGGTGSVTEKTVVAGEPYGELPVPDERAGYTFLGWSVDGTVDGIVTAESVVTIDEDHSLIAVWELADDSIAVKFKGADEVYVKEDAEYTLSVAN